MIDTHTHYITITILKGGGRILLHNKILIRASNGLVSSGKKPQIEKCLHHRISAHLIFVDLVKLYHINLNDIKLTNFA